MIEKELGHSFDVEPGAVLRLRHGDADVSIKGWERDTVQVVVRYRAEVRAARPDELRDFEVEFEQRGKEILATGREPTAPGSAVDLRVLEYRYLVLAPPWVELDLEGEDGSVKVQDWNAPVALRGEDGSVRIDGLEAPTLSCRGEDASFRLARIRVPWVEVALDDGELDLQLLDAGPLDLSVRGKDAKIAVTLERSIAAAYSIRHDEGSVRVAAPGDQQASPDGRHVSGQIGDGRGGEIRIEVEDGAVVLGQE